MMDDLTDPTDHRPEPNKSGFVYLLSSPGTAYFKIGGSDHPPLKRLAEINHSAPYAALGPWDIADFRQVYDWRSVEQSLHARFEGNRAHDVPNTRELFAINLGDGRAAFDAINNSVLVNFGPIDRMFHEPALAHYLERLFLIGDLHKHLGEQGAWTLSLYPSTAGGRFFTLNIGRHEVAFTSLRRPSPSTRWFCIVMDTFVEDYPETMEWLRHNHGELSTEAYASAGERHAQVLFAADFDGAEAFLAKPGVADAIFSYWGSYLKKMGHSQSLYARYHNYNAAAAIANRLRDRLATMRQPQTR